MISGNSLKNSLSNTAACFICGLCFLHLSEICKSIDAEQFLYLSRGETKDTDSKARRYILANAFEAIIGAIYLDQGWEAAKEFIERTVLVHLKTILEKRLYIDPKSRFQEMAQEKFGITPVYKVLEESGPDHAKLFIIGVHLGKEMIATGEGTSKHEAQVAAADAAIKEKGW